MNSWTASDFLQYISSATAKYLVFLLSDVSSPEDFVISFFLYGGWKSRLSWACYNEDRKLAQLIIRKISSKSVDLDLMLTLAFKGGYLNLIEIAKIREGVHGDLNLLVGRVIRK